MATPFLSEIRIFSFGFAPRGWALCDGQLLAINQNQALFSLMGTFYGGNGTSNFALPNLQGRIAVGMGTETVGQTGGETAHTLTSAEMPQHTHAVSASSANGGQASPAGNVWAVDPNGSQTFGSSPDVTVNHAAIQNTGGNQPHDNMMPYLVLNFCIALTGIFPSRN